MWFKNKTEKEIADHLEKEVIDTSFSGLVWARFRKNRLALWSLRSLYILLFIAVFANFIANDKPIYCQIDGEIQFPVFREIGIDLGLVNTQDNFNSTKWTKQKYESVIWPLIPYSSTGLDFKNSRYKSPFDKQNVPSFRFRHFLGTDDLGRDVASGMVYGTRIGLSVGFIAMFLATLIGLFFGALAGWYGDNRFRVSRIRLLLNIFAIFPAFFYAFSVRSFVLSESDTPFLELGKSALLFVGIFLFFNLVAKGLERISVLGKTLILPLDLILMRFIEVMNSIPGLLLLLASVAVFPKQSIYTVMVIIGLIGWTGIARFVRAEFLKIKKLAYIESAEALGLTDFQIIWRHALPNALTPILITVAFGIAGAILLEASLSFLGIGAGAEEMTWGRLLRHSRDHFSAWWLAVFPGMAIFLTVTIFNLIGEGLTDAIEGKS